MYFFAPFLFVSIYFSEYQKSDQKKLIFQDFMELYVKNTNEIHRMGFICTNQDHRLSRWFALPLEGVLRADP